MTQYAIHELNTLLGSLPMPLNDGSPAIRYVCALFAELAYYHVPQWEIDDKKRAKLIPCDAYQALVARGFSTDIGILLNELDLPRSFVVADRGAIAVGLVINQLLFVGIRGTQFLFDWKINLRSRLVPVNSRFRFRPPFVFSTVFGRLHSGFGEESVRISTRILDAIRDSNLGNIDHVFLTGHSMGGAVAAIAENFVKVAPTSVCIFGAPRYSDLSAYISLPNGPPAQVRRHGDVAPIVPPKLFGYVDHPYEFGTDGMPYIDPSLYSSTFGSLLRWVRFFSGRSEPHSMESYRYELGVTAGASGASLPLVPIERLALENICAR